MEISIFLAKVVGVYFIIMGLLALTSQKGVMNMVDQLKDKANFLVLGFVTTLIGLLMVVSHSVWTTPHQIAISLIGWVSFIKGLIILFFPTKFFDEFIEMINKPALYSAFGVAALLVGFWLVYYGFII